MRTLHRMRTSVVWHWGAKLAVRRLRCGLPRTLTTGDPKTYSVRFDSTLIDRQSVTTMPKIASSFDQLTPNTACSCAVVICRAPRSRITSRSRG